MPDEIDSMDDLDYERFIEKHGRVLCVKCGHTAQAHGFGDIPEPKRCDECDCQEFEPPDLERYSFLIGDGQRCIR
jgi:hypothetical protein